MFVERPPGTGRLLLASNGALYGALVLDPRPQHSQKRQLGSLLRKEAGCCPGEITGSRQSGKRRLALGRDTGPEGFMVEAFED